MVKCLGGISVLNVPFKGKNKSLSVVLPSIGRTIVLSFGYMWYKYDYRHCIAVVDSPPPMRERKSMVAFNFCENISSKETQCIKFCALKSIVGPGDMAHWALAAFAENPSSFPSSHIRCPQPPVSQDLEHLISSSGLCRHL